MSDAQGGCSQLQWCSRLDKVCSFVEPGIKECDRIDISRYHYLRNDIRGNGCAVNMVK